MTSWSVPTFPLYAVTCRIQCRSVQAWVWLQNLESQQQIQPQHTSFSAILVAMATAKNVDEYTGHTARRIGRQVWTGTLQLQVHNERNWCLPVVNTMRWVVIRNWAHITVTRSNNLVHLTDLKPARLCWAWHGLASKAAFWHLKPTDWCWVDYIGALSICCSTVAFPWVWWFCLYLHSFWWHKSASQDVLLCLVSTPIF